jgi:hypothetical protein
LPQGWRAAPRFLVAFIMRRRGLPITSGEAFTAKWESLTLEIDCKIFGGDSSG